MLSCWPARHEALRSRLPGLDQAALVAAAARHGVSAFVADFLSAGSVSLSEGPAAQLTRDARSQVGQGLRIKRLTLAVLDAARGVGVRPVLLKGAGLAARLFPEQPLGRPASDVDVLVLPEELPLLTPALTGLGLRESRDPGLEDVFEEHHHLSFSGERGLVEVHFKLFTGFAGNRFDERALQARVRAGEFEGRAVGWLGPEDELAYLAVHAANHGFLRASWLLDLARYLDAYPELDWDVVAARCAAAGLEHSVAASLWVLESALERELPRAARRCFPVGRVRRRAYRWAFSRAHLERADLAVSRAGSVLLRTLLVDSARDGARGLATGLGRLRRRRASD